MRARLPPRLKFWLLRGSLSLVVLVLVLAYGLLVWITSSPGERWLRAQLVHRANAALSGQLSVQGLELGLGRLTLTGVALEDPEGRPVAELERAEARVELLALVRGRVVARSVRLVRPRVHLHEGEPGLGLARALAPRQPAAPSSSSRSLPVWVEVQRLTLEEGTLTLESSTAARQVRLEGLAVQGQGSFRSAGQRLAVSLETTGQLRQPWEGPLHLSLQGQGRKGQLSGELTLSAAGLELQARGRRDTPQQAHVEVVRLTLPPEAQRAALPGAALAVPLSLAGTLEQTGSSLRVDVEAQAAGASAWAEGAVDLRRRRTEGLSARLRNVDLSRLLGDGPATTLAADLRVRGGGTSLETMDLEVDLSVPASRIRNQPLGPATLQAKLSSGRLELSRLEVHAPGASLTAHGGGPLEDLRLQGRLVASSLDTFADSVGRLGKAQPLALSGRGTLDFSLQGALRQPSLSLRGDFPSLAWKDTALRQLVLEATLPDATRPFHAQASLQARSLRTGGRSFQRLEATLTSQGPALSARVRAQGPDLGLALRGTVDAEGRRLALSALTLHFPEGTWRLRRPTRLELTPGRLAVAPLTLTSGRQSLSLSLLLTGQSLEASAHLRGVDLGRLPRALLPPSLELAGRLSGRVQARGRLPRPQAEVSLTLEGGRYQQYKGLELALEGAYARDRARGTLKALTPAGRLSARFDTPLEGLLQRRREPVHVELELERLELRSALALAGRTLPLSGTLHGTLEVQGLASAPRVVLALQGQQLHWRGALPGLPDVMVEPLDVELSARSGGPGPSREQAAQGTVRLELHARRAGASVAEASATLGARLLSAQSLEALARVPFTLSARAGPLPLREVPGLRAQSEQEQLRGLLSLELDTHGTLEAPRVELSAHLENAGLQQVALGQVRLHYTYAQSRSRLEAALDSPGDGTLRLEGQATQELSLPALRRGVAFSQVPLEARLEARRFDPAFLAGLVPGVRELGGMLEANARLAGTLAQPSLLGRLEWGNGRIALVSFGEYRNVQLVLEATEQRVQLTRLFVNGRGGSFQASGEASRLPSGPYAFHGQTEAKDFPLFADEQLLALVSLRGDFEGTLSGELINVRRVTIPEAHVTLPEESPKELQPLDRPNDIVLVRNGEPLRRRRGVRARSQEGVGGAGRKESRLRLVVNVEAPRNLWVRGSDIEGEVGLSEDFRFEYAGAPALYGEVRALRGDLQVLGRRFQLQRDSRVRFTGPVRQPYVSVVAEHENEREGVKVLVTAQGQGKDFSLKVTSEPPLPESDLYMLLATGRRNLRPNSGAGAGGTAQVASALGSLLASQARKVLSTQLPLDVVSIEAGEAGMGLQGTRLEVGKYLTDRLYISYSGRVRGRRTSENTHEGNLEYQFSPHWGLEARFGDALRGSLNLIWSQEY